jgi:thiamine-monophosphate kinase
MREFEFVELIRSRWPQSAPGLTMGIGDDCAHLSSVNAKTQLITTDLLSHGVHFSERFISWEDIGWRCVAVNLSDLAASGADPALPIFLFLSLAIPLEIPKEKLVSMIDGIDQCAKKFGAVVAGGDSTGTDGPLTVNITAVGYTDHAVARNGAKPDQILCACGFVGKAGAGLTLLDTGRGADERDTLTMAYARPKPLLAVGHVLAQNNLVTAMIDVSDGVLSDAGHIAQASGCNLSINVEKLPVTSATIKAVGAEKAYQLAAGFGDDYALLCAMPRENFEAAEKLVVDAGSTIAQVGTFTPGKGIVTATFENEPFIITKSGYQHTLGR